MKIWMSLKELINWIISLMNKTNNKTNKNKHALLTNLNKLDLTIVCWYKSKLISKNKVKSIKNY